MDKAGVGGKHVFYDTLIRLFIYHVNKHVLKDVSILCNLFSLICTAHNIFASLNESYHMEDYITCQNSFCKETIAVWPQGET